MFRGKLIPDEALTWTSQRKRRRLPPKTIWQGIVEQELSEMGIMLG